MPSEKPLAKRRRLAAQRVREARERLTSTTGTRVAFDYELLRQFAENRLSASLVVLLLIGTVGFLSSVWIGAVVAGAWTAAVLVIHAVIVTKCRQFLSEPSTTQDLKRWRLRFIILDLFYGLAWMYNLIHPVGQDEGSSTFMLFVMLLVVAVSSMLASSLPIAVFAATVPVTFAVALELRAARRPAQLHPRHHGDRRAGLFHAAGAPAVFGGPGDAGGARRKGCADRRARTGETRSPTTRGGAPKAPTSPSRNSSPR